MNKNLIIIVTATIASVVTWVLTSRYKDKAYKELQKKHDKETAERLSKEFNKRIDELEEKHKKEKEEFKKKVSDLCKEFGISDITLSII